MLAFIRRHARLLFGATILAGTLGATTVALAQGDCCAPGAPCCYPGSPCCAGHAQGK